MQVRVFDDTRALAAAAAGHAAATLRRVLGAAGRARLVAATGASQVEFLQALVRTPGIRWQDVELFHLDEYVGLPADHPASFRRYLVERLVRPAGIARWHPLAGERDPEEVCARVGRELQAAPVDLAFVGIGENGHVAFNDPPADFQTTEPYIVVRLDEACRRQQVGEGWFRSVAEVPERAISMSVRQVLAARTIVSVVPDARKAAAVKACLEGEVSPRFPASVLQTHPDTTVYLDRDSAARLSPRTA